MKISDEERRRVASHLRELSETDSLIYELKPSDLFYSSMLLMSIRAIVGKGDIFERLADLIDRPTCRNIGGEEGTNGEHYDFFCSACGYAGDFAEPNYCPNCGAEVVHDA